MLPKRVAQPSEFVPSGWKTVAIKSGDLNGDKRADVAVLMRKIDPANIKPVDSSPYYKQDDTNPYLLAIGFARADGYAIVASHNALFPSEVGPIHGDTPPDASAIEILRGVLTLEFEHLRSSDRFRFRWNGKAFVLIGYDCGGVAGGDVSTLSANYLTRRARIGRGQVGRDEMDERTVRIRPGKRPTLDQIEWDFDRGTEVGGDPIAC